MTRMLHALIHVHQEDEDEESKEPLTTFVDNEQTRLPRPSPNAVYDPIPAASPELGFAAHP